MKDKLSEIMGYWLERDGGKNRLYVQLWNNPAKSKNDVTDNRLFDVAESPDLPVTQKRGLLISEVRGHNSNMSHFSAVEIAKNACFYGKNY